MYGFNYFVVVNLVCIYIKVLIMFINLFLMYVFVDFFCNDIIFLILIFMCLKLFRNINIIIFKGFDSVL